MTTIRARFYIGWKCGTEGAEGEDTRIYNHLDLEERGEFYEFDVPNIGSEKDIVALANTIGCGMAFRDNWTARDSLSYVVLL